jgi:hypothetical protein
MKRTLLLLAAKLLPGSQSIAQPATITWQGKLIDTSGNAITQNNMIMTLAMLAQFAPVKFSIKK